MIKNILTIATLCFAFILQNQANAQSLKSEANFWIKGSEAKSKVNLNGNFPISDQIQGAIMTPIGDAQSNFYVVFQSSDFQEVDLINMNFKCFNNKMTTHNINTQGLDVLLPEKIKAGAIVKYGFDLGNYKVTDDFMLVNNDKDETFIYEVIYMNKSFDVVDHKYLQTYLSLKYGISLINNENYLSNKNQILWDLNRNPEYNKHITGLGKSNYFELNQTKSVNSVDKLLTISSNTLNNEEYVLIGNNGKLNRFDFNGEEIFLEKEYLVQTTSSDEEIVSLHFDTSLIENFDATKSFFILLNNQSKLPGKIINNFLVFTDVILNSGDNGIDRFTIGVDKSSIKAELTEAWFLNERGSTTIQPNVKVDKNLEYKIEWYFNNQLISNKKDLVTNKTGVYEMRITFNNITNSYQTTVYNRIDPNTSNEISVYPNPIKAGDDFKISYNLASEANVDIFMYQLNGKLVLQRNLGRFNQEEFNFKLESAGVYLIVSKINGKSVINKIIIN